VFSIVTDIIQAQQMKDDFVKQVESYGQTSEESLAD
jgi:hypothetical protein